MIRISPGVMIFMKTRLGWDGCLVNALSYSHVCRVVRPTPAIPRQPAPGCQVQAVADRLGCFGLACRAWTGPGLAAGSATSAGSGVQAFACSAAGAGNRAGNRAGRRSASADIPARVAQGRCVRADARADPVRASAGCRCTGRAAGTGCTSCCDGGACGGTCHASAGPQRAGIASDNDRSGRPGCLRAESCRCRGAPSALSAPRANPAMAGDHHAAIGTRGRRPTAVGTRVKLKRT